MPGCGACEEGRTFPFGELPELLEALKAQREFTRASQEVVRSSLSAIHTFINACRVMPSRLDS